MAQKRGPRLRGQRLLDNAPCQAAVNLGSSALLFPRPRALLVQHRPDRHAKGSPFGRAGERSETERASPGQKSFCAAISRFFVRAILSLCFYISVSILALSVTFGDTSPKGRGFGRPGHFLLDAGGPIWRKRAGLAYGASGFWTTHLDKLP